ncbi:hypothetical protein [Blautia phage Montmirail]|nr:hypothetical protein [Blautia phage Montmirail]
MAYPTNHTNDFCVIRTNIFRVLALSDRIGYII